MDTTRDSNQLASERQKEANLIKWQSRLVPWMVVLPTILILVFIYLATSQLNSFSKEINNYKASELDKIFLNNRDSTLKIPVKVNEDEFVKMYTLAKMDEQLMNKRYSQGGALLISRLYTKYLGFFTGMILAIVGAVFIISKLSESASNLQASGNAFKLSLVSASPGIIFGILGTCLMMTTILTQNDIDIKDVATYLNAGMYPNNKILIEDAVPESPIDSLMQHSSPFDK